MASQVNHPMLGLLALLPLALARFNEATSTIWVDATEATGYQWAADWNRDIQIHSSCNRTQYIQLIDAWEETKDLSAHARDHTSRYGNDSEIYRKYFGEAPTAEVIG